MNLRLKSFLQSLQFQLQCQCLSSFLLHLTYTFIAATYMYDYSTKRGRLYFIDFIISCSDDFIFSFWWEANLFRINSRLSSPISNSRVPINNLRCLFLINSTYINNLRFRPINSSNYFYRIRSSQLLILTHESMWLSIFHNNQVYHLAVSKQVLTQRYRQVSFLQYTSGTRKCCLMFRQIDANYISVLFSSYFQHGYSCRVALKDSCLTNNVVVPVNKLVPATSLLWAL